MGYKMACKKEDRVLKQGVWPLEEEGDGGVLLGVGCQWSMKV